MMITGRHIPRRTMIRGVGAALALPFLDGMVPALTPARLTAAAPATRLGIVFVPMGANMQMWAPKTEGPLELSPIQRSLEKVRDKVLVLSGLDNREAEPRVEDGGGTHSRCQATWATSVRAKKTAGADFHLGKSVDQVVAQLRGQDTQLQSLELALESGEAVGQCDYGYTCAYSSTIAWSTPTTPLPMEINPRAVFERMFGDADSTDAGVRLARRRMQASLLDAVTSELADFQRGLGSRDRVKITEYLDAVRDVERRIQKAEEQSGRELPLVMQPAGVPASYEEHGTLMFDLLTLAYQTDLTRVATFMFGRELSNRAYPEIGIAEPHHPLSHHGYNADKLAKLAKLNAFHMGLFARFVERLGATPDGDGSLLDHTILLYGSSMSDSHVHAPLDVPTMVVGGTFAGIKGGRHLRYDKGTPLANLQLAILRKMGVSIDHYGDSTGELNLSAV